MAEVDPNTLPGYDAPVSGKDEDEYKAAHPDTPLMSDVVKLIREARRKKREEAFQAISDASKKKRLDTTGEVDRLTGKVKVVRVPTAREQAEAIVKKTP